MKANIFIRICRFFVIKLYYPLIATISYFFAPLKDGLRRSFISINNYFVLKYLNKFATAKTLKVLIILPHCLQNNDCAFRITKSIKNCQVCGKCVVCQFVDFEEKFGTPICIATGGTLARMAVLEHKPDFIIACACERDLSSGIFDSYPYLAYGILNERPNGHCISTTVDVEKIVNILKVIK